MPYFPPAIPPPLSDSTRSTCRCRGQINSAANVRRARSAVPAKGLLLVGGKRRSRLMCLRSPDMAHQWRVCRSESDDEPCGGPSGAPAFAKAGLLFLLLVTGIPRANLGRLAPR